MDLLKKIMIIGFILSMRYRGSTGKIGAMLEGQNEDPFPNHLPYGCNLVRDGCIYNAYCYKNFRDVSYRSTLIDGNDYQCENLIYNLGEKFLPINIMFRVGDSDPFQKTEEHRVYYDNHYAYRSPNVFVHMVDFSYNGYSDIPNIADLYNLKTLNISHNMLTIATLSNSRKMEFLQEIDFSFNNIETIDVPKEDQYTYTGLKVLNLSNNILTVIPEEIFDHVIKLEQLDLSHNLISVINSFTFFSLKHLIVLNLSYNNIVSLSHSLAKLYTLKKLYLQENKLFDIEYNDTRSLKLLINVDLSGNNIRNIENGVFSNMLQLGFLSLKNNNLSTLQRDMFYNCNKLEYVDLSHNKITNLPIYIFKQNNISYFSISENNIHGNLAKGMFEGLKNVKNLDLSYQKITSIDDAAFLGIENINELLLNNNQISKLNKHSFKLLTKLIRLDLSHNFISNFTLNTEDLINLEYLSLSNNELTHIDRTQLQFLNKIEFLDVSSNKIISIEPKSFSLQPFLKVLLISNNQLHGSLSQDAFNGLQAIPELDLSYSFLTSISNRSFDGMQLLNSINISYCSIVDIQYNAFINTGNLVTLDFSHNQLTYLNINTTEMTSLKTLILRTNLIQTLQKNLFDKIIHLQTLDLSSNSLLHLDDDVFSSLGNLEFLDVSNNFNFTLRFEIVKYLENLKTLKLSGTKANITFDWKQNSLLELEMFNADVRNLSFLKLKNNINLFNLVLNHNEVSNLGENIANMSTLQSLDLSYNKISNLQPGSFTGCTNLNLLNISHNSITNINYGTFNGLMNLHVLDVSYNLLKNLEDDKFYQVHSLEQLIVDNNKILYVTIEQFLGTNLKILSIGGNPLPCKALIKLKHDDYPLQITAMVLDKNSEHNYNGVVCVDNLINKGDLDYSNKKENNYHTEGDVNILIDIRNILKDLMINTVKHNDWVSLSNILSNAQNSSTREELNNIVTILRSFSNLTREKDETKNKVNDDIKLATEKTNSLLERILKVIVAKNYVATTLPFENKSNSTNYLKDLKELENNFILEKEKIVSEFDDKISALSKKIQVNTENSYSKSPNFTEVCVALILLIIVCCVAFYIYRTQVISIGQRHERSMSRRQITVDMDNSNL